MFQVLWSKQFEPRGQDISRRRVLVIVHAKLTYIGKTLINLRAIPREFYKNAKVKNQNAKLLKCENSFLEFSHLNFKL